MRFPVTESVMADNEERKGVTIKVPRVRRVDPGPDGVGFNWNDILMRRQQERFQVFIGAFPSVEQAISVHFRKSEVLVSI